MISLRRSRSLSVSETWVVSLSERVMCEAAVVSEAVRRAEMAFSNELGERGRRNVIGTSPPNESKER